MRNNDMVEPQLRIVHCLRCSHSWPTKGNPRVCPKCKSAYWNVPKKGEK